MNQETIVENIEKRTVGLDDTFKFHCTQCGKCCLFREDIILSPMDIYKISKELSLTPHEFVDQFCSMHIGDTSRIPIIMLKPVGKDLRCPLLKNNKCSVHKAKPSVCALYPLGRYATANPNNCDEKDIAKDEVKYFLQPVNCGDDSQSHTVREWLSDFDIKLEDEAFLLWRQAIAKISADVQKLENKWDIMTTMKIMLPTWSKLRVLLYEHYNIAHPFMPQFKENVETITNMLRAIL